MSTRTELTVKTMRRLVVFICPKPNKIRIVRQKRNALYCNSMRYTFIFASSLILLGASCTPFAFQNSDTAMCSYDGSTYAMGASFPSSDGCNSCSCGENGEVACTLRACAPTLPVTQCAQASDCESQDLDRSFCDAGAWACVNTVCEFQCDISSKL